MEEEPAADEDGCFFFFDLFLFFLELFVGVASTVAMETSIIIAKMTTVRIMNN